TPSALRPKARLLAAEAYTAWRAAGRVVAVRVNPLDQDGMDDLAAVMRGRPDIVALPKVAEPHHVARLDEAVGRFEREYGIPEGVTALLPNIEFARGLVQIGAIAGVTRRTIGCLLASVDRARRGVTAVRTLTADAFFLEIFQRAGMERDWRAVLHLVIERETLGFLVNRDDVGLLLHQRLDDGVGVVIAHLVAGDDQVPH